MVGMIVIGIIYLIIAWVFFVIFGLCDNDKTKTISLIGASILMILGSMFIAFGWAITWQGYAINKDFLPVHGVCDVLYTAPTGENSTGVLMKLPNGQLRLFQLPEKPEIGLVKVQPDYTLKPFSASSAEVLAEKEPGQ